MAATKIQQADLSRYMIVHHYGGFYAGTVCVRARARACACVFASLRLRSRRFCSAVLGGPTLRGARVSVQTSTSCVRTATTLGL
jgi:hypothetical protein